MLHEAGVVREVDDLDRSAPDDVDRPDRGGEALEIHHRPASLPSARGPCRAQATLDGGRGTTPGAAVLAAGPRARRHRTSTLVGRYLQVLQVERRDLRERGSGDDAAEDRPGAAGRR